VINSGRDVPDIDILLRYYPIVKFLKSFYKPDTKILEVGSFNAGIATFFPVPVTALDIRFADDIDDKLVTKVVSSVENIPFEEKTFDVVISIDMFEHLSKGIRNLALGEFFRVAKPHGKIVIAVPCGELSSIHENLLNVIYRLFRNREHPWLKEHIAYGLPDWKELYKQIKSVNGNCRIQVLNNINVFVWFWLYIFKSILPVSMREILVQMVFPIIRNVNIVPYRKIFIIYPHPSLSPLGRG